MAAGRVPCVAHTLMCALTKSGALSEPSAEYPKPLKRGCQLPRSLVNTGDLPFIGNTYDCRQQSILDISIRVADHLGMHSSPATQYLLKGQAFRPYEDTWPADNRLHRRPSSATTRTPLMQAARRMRRHWPTKPQQRQLARRAA